MTARNPFARRRCIPIMLGCYVSREAALERARDAGGYVTRDMDFSIYEVWCDARDAPDELPFR